MQEQIQKIIGEFRKQFTRDDGLLDIDKYAHDEIEDFITKAYQSGREDGREKLAQRIDAERKNKYGNNDFWNAGYEQGLQKGRDICNGNADKSEELLTLTNNKDE